MLTADLAMSWRRGERIHPRYIKREDAEFLQDAADLINLFREHEGRTRALLERELQEYVGVGTDYRILRGLIKLLMDRCTFEIPGSVDPVEIRRALFLRAREHHPLTESSEARKGVVASTALELGCEAEAVLESLYADLPDNQRLVEFEEILPQELLDRYNLAQAQALLYRAVGMRLRVEPQTAAGYRQLFNAIKAYRLIHTIKGSAREGYEIFLNGPVSMFHRSQKYGVQMAVFLPALLLCEGWQMRAEIAQKPQGSLLFELDSRQTQLRTHYLPEMNYENPVLEKLAANWERANTAWRLRASGEVVDLKGGAFIPDFVLSHADGHKFYLEVLGFWTPQHLKERLEEFERGAFKNYLIAAWDELRGTRDPLTRVPPHVIIFKKKLDPVVVELALNELINQEETVEASGNE
jgi:predicted nuclease of restriction endonuclease-like RecB superfamily